MDRQPWELTDEEIAEVEHDAHDVCSRCEGEGRLWADGLVHYYDANRPTKACPNCDGDGRVMSGNEGRDVAKAAQKKLVEWFEQNYAEPSGQVMKIALRKWEEVKAALGVSNG